MAVKDVALAVTATVADTSQTNVTDTNRMNVNETDLTATIVAPVVESSWSLPLVLFIVIVSTVSILGLKKLCEMAKEQI